jgi:hypothetical protein
MTKQHKATPEQWETIERYAGTSDPYACFLELRARIEALEAAQHNPRAATSSRYQAAVSAVIGKRDAPAPGGVLLERVTWLIAKRFSESSPGTDCTPFGRDVILEVAAWLKEEGYSTLQAEALAQEANR